MLFTFPLRPVTIGLACVLPLCAMAPLTWAASDAAPTKPAAIVAAPAGQTYKPKAGETLDQVIAKTMGTSPLSMGILRKAFIDQNPQAIVPGNLPKLRKGATLNVPDHDLLLRGVLASVTPVAAPPEASPRPVQSTPEDRKRWVQFP
jgi:Tfp pilus assembly protein FimV